MTKCKTKTNGTLKGKHCKTDSKQKKTYPVLKWSEPKTKKFKNAVKYVGQNHILYTDLETKKVKKSKIVKILKHPILSFKKHNYLVKKVVVLTADNKKVKINNIDLITGSVRGSIEVQ